MGWVGGCGWGGGIDTLHLIHNCLEQRIERDVGFYDRYIRKKVQRESVKRSTTPLNSLNQGSVLQRDPAREKRVNSRCRGKTEINCSGKKKKEQ